MTTKALAYARASSYSFTLHAKQLSFPVRTDVPTPMTFGVQPLGITSLPFEDGDMIALANYTAPAQHVGKVTVRDNTLTRALTRVAGAMNGITWRRGGFPDIDNVAQANRCWTAILAPEGRLWVGRGDSEFFVLAPPAGEDKQWRVTDRIVLPRIYGNYPHTFVASATLISNGRLFTVEHDGEYVCEAVEWEVMRDGTIKRVIVHPLGKFRYGIAVAKVDGNESLITITAFHSTDVPGIYFGTTRIVSDIFGDGICPLSNGGALITRRGMESPEADSLEAPGALIYVPPSMFPSGFEWVR